jgi:aminoglycoside 3-N-acetyltransferase
MSEGNIVTQTAMPNTVSSLRRDFENLGVQSGAVIIMHSALSKLGWTAGGPVAVVQAILDVLTPDGTLIMPTHTSENSEPSYWQHPPIPENWWQIVRDEMPAFRPEITPTRQMGAIVEVFRSWPGVRRSNHPQHSFAAWGKHAEIITATHALESFDDHSPLARIYDLDGQVLLLGVNHSNNTSLHLAEYRSNFPSKGIEKQGGAMLVNGKREWVTWEMLTYDSEDFEQCGAAYEANIAYMAGKIGQAEARLVSQRGIVDFGVHWFEENRQGQV